MTQMKKIFLFLSIALMSAALSAQQPYNGSFEHWSSIINPDGWGTWATVVGGSNPNLADSMVRFARKDSLNTPGIYTQDTSSVRIAVDTITQPSQSHRDTLAGFVSLGGATNAVFPDTPVGLRFGYYPYQKYPDSLILDYKYVVPPGFIDTALVVMTMIRHDSFPPPHEIFYLNNSWTIPPSSGWAHMSIPLRDYYQNRDTFLADSIQLFVLCSLSQHPQPGTVLWLDSIHFDASVNIIDTSHVGIHDIASLKGITAYPNPTTDVIHVLVPETEIGSSMQLYDPEGRQVCTTTIDRSDQTISTQCFPPGVYTLRVNSNDHLTVYSGRITVLRRE